MVTLVNICYNVLNLGFEFYGIDSLGTTMDIFIVDDIVIHLWGILESHRSFYVRYNYIFIYFFSLVWPENNVS